MKPVTIYVSKTMYLQFQQAAIAQDRKTAELIREAMELYAKLRLEKNKNLDSWSPLSLGAVKNDWLDNSWHDDLLEGGYDRD